MTFIEYSFSAFVQIQSFYFGELEIDKVNKNPYIRFCPKKIKHQKWKK